LNYYGSLKTESEIDFPSLRAEELTLPEVRWALINAVKMFDE
jgi:hypothetical protein